MSMTISIRVSHLNAVKSSGQRGHDLRSGSGGPAYVDKQRTHENSVIIEPLRTQELREICIKRREQRNMKLALRKNANLATVGIITFGTDAQKVINALSKQEQDEMFSNVAHAIAEHLDNEITGLVVHRDESAIHAHFQMPSFRKDGHPNTHRIKKSTTRELQDIAASQVAKYQITRGKSKAQRIADGDDISKIIHQSVEQLHNTLPIALQNAKDEIAELNDIAEHAKQALLKETAKLTELKITIAQQQERLQKNERLLAEQKQKLEAGKVSEEKAMKRCEVYERRANDAQKQLEDAQTKIAELYKQYEYYQNAVITLQQKLSSDEMNYTRRKEEMQNDMDAFTSGWRQLANQVTKLPPAQAVLFLSQLSNGINSITDTFEKNVAKDQQQPTTWTPRRP